MDGAPDPDELELSEPARRFFAAYWGVHIGAVNPQPGVARDDARPAIQLPAEQQGNTIGDLSRIVNHVQMHKCTAAYCMLRHENTGDVDGMSSETRQRSMNDAAAKPDPTLWQYTDGAGNPDNKNDWKIVEPIIQNAPEPPPYTKLSDVQVFNVITQVITQVDKHKNWPTDFESRGGIHPERPPQNPTVHVSWKSKVYYLVLGEYYILCGSACRPLKEWLIGAWTNRV